VLVNECEVTLGEARIANLVLLLFQPIRYDMPEKSRGATHFSFMLKLCKIVLSAVQPRVAKVTHRKLSKQSVNSCQALSISFCSIVEKIQSRDI